MNTTKKRLSNCKSIYYFFEVYKDVVLVLWIGSTEGSMFTAIPSFLVGNNDATYTVVQDYFEG